ncbi:MAG: Holliday junction branch migration DNA helicase RuvB, partial [Candidatus Omnitrophica bacterium]|nr:Holliday junction branch migration DNA helicase RuvB [Candidatus Omnitrophota bacterium]
LRPKTLKEYIGQSQLKENLSIALEAAKKRSEPVDHILFHGPPGLGKTTLAHIIANEMASELVTTSGPSLQQPTDLLGILTNLSEGDILFIDEIHRLSTVIEEYLYPAMEDFEIDFVVDKGAFAKTIKIPLKRFTLVGATTRAGFLSAPLRDRFGLFQHLDFYEPVDLATIVSRSAGILKVEIDGQGSDEIATRSRGTPRVANRLLRRVRDYAQVKADGRINSKVAQQSLKMEGVDELGLDDLDRKYLRTIIEFYRGGPVGIDAIGATLNEESETLEDLVEPYLLKIGFLQRTSRGRCAGPRAWEHLGMSPPEARETEGPTLFDS